MEKTSPESGAGARQRIVDAFERVVGRAPTVEVRAPGRVALLGAHIDYSDGRVMPAAIVPAVRLVAGPRRDRRWHVTAVDLGASVTFDPRDLPPPIPEAPREVRWHDYPAGVAWVLEKEGGPVPGMDVAYGGNLPAGAGVSSSAAVEVAFLLACVALGKDRNGRGAEDRRRLARLAQRVENEYLGLGSGIMDPFGILFGRRDHLVDLDCRTHEHELLPLPPGLEILVVDSGVRRRLASSGFNDRRAQCERATELFREITGDPDLRTLRDVSPEAFARHARSLPVEIRRRARHAVEEMARVKQAAEDLRAGNVEAFGRAMNASHRSSRDLYEVSLPELDLLCETAWAHPGCHGAKLMGGGFGGCVAALARGESAEELETEIVGAFERSFGRRPAVFKTPLADGAETRPHDSRGEISSG